jgi:GTP cyclohydrolase II
MTNNPAKLDGLRDAGVRVTAHEPHWVESSEHSADYLRVKQDKMGHIEPRGAEADERIGDP